MSHLTNRPILGDCPLLSFLNPTDEDDSKVYDENLQRQQEPSTMKFNFKPKNTETFESWLDKNKALPMTGA